MPSDEVGTHHRDSEEAEHPHHRSSDDLIKALFDLVVQLDAKVEDHIKNEMPDLQKLVETQQKNFQELLKMAFPNGDFEKHRKIHEEIDAHTSFPMCIFRRKK